MISENRLIVYLIIYSSILVTIDLVYNQVYGQNIESLDLECRTNYHSYCFGDQWNNLVDDYCDDIENYDSEYCDYYNPIVQEEKSVSIFEDQSYLCKHKNHTGNSTNHEIICIIINDDDFMNRDQLDTIMNQFKNDLDTFSVNNLIGDMS